MNSNSGHDPVPPSILVFLFRLFLPAVALGFLGLLGFPAAHAVTSLSETARMEAADRLDPPRIRSLFRTYLSLGLRKEAAEFLERKIHVGDISPQAASPLFHEIVMGRNLWEDPGTLVSVCETALRSGVRTSLILYSYGTGLRLSGRPSEGAAFLSQVGPESPVYPYALYAIGQVAAEEGKWNDALEVFTRIRKMEGGKGKGESLKRRSALSQAESLLALGRNAEAARSFQEFLREENDPRGRIGWAAAGIDNGSEGEEVPAEIISGWPIRQRVLFFLLQGGLSREHGHFDRAISNIGHAETELENSLSLPAPPASESLERDPAWENLLRLIQRHRSLRKQLYAETIEEISPAARANFVEMLMGLLLMEHSISRAGEGLPAPPSFPEPSLSPDRGMEILRRIEQVAFDGLEVDRLVEVYARKLDTLENLAHPIQRYRLLARLEKSQAKIHEIQERIRQYRNEALAGLEAGEATDASRLLKDMGLFLEELDILRDTEREAREITRKNFNIFRQGAEVDTVSKEKLRQALREALAFENERFTTMLPVVQEMEKRSRVVSWERKRKDLMTLRPVIRRHLVDSLVSKAKSLSEKPKAGGRMEFRAALEQAASFLGGDRLSPGDRIECAINIGYLLMGEAGRWEPYPGRPVGENETAMIGTILAALRPEGQSWERKEEALYVAAVLRRMVGDPGARKAATEYLEKYPRSPHAGEFAVRLGHEALLSGRTGEAAGLYRTAAEGSSVESAAVASYMLGWARYQNGDAEGATRQLSLPLSDPSFQCGNPSPFEQAVLSLAVRAWKETPIDLLPSYGPVRDARCSAKLLIASLGEAEEKRGESVRAAAVYDLMAAKHPGEGEALGYELKSIEGLRRAGREKEALSRAFALKEKYGPGSSWEESQPQPSREKARAELAETLRTLSEQKFAEGIRTGDRSAMATAAAGLGQYFSLKKAETTDSDAELRLKWAIASLQSGGRDAGINLLRELVKDHGTDPIGEKAEILYAETMIAGYERREQSAGEAEDSVALLLSNFPSEKAAGLASRAASDFLGAGEYERAARLGEKIESTTDLPMPLLVDARLVQAESFFYLNDLASTRRKAISILEGEEKGGNSRSRDRAKDLFLLSSLKEADAKTAANDWNGAAILLEEAANRLPESPEAPQNYLRAIRSYRMGEEKDGILRVGQLFLRKFPLREETVEVAAIVGLQLEERKEYLAAADLYADVAERFPKNSQAIRFLFRAALLANDHGKPEVAKKRFYAFRGRYSNPRWMNAYASLTIGLLDWKSGETKSAVRELEEGLHRVSAGVESDAPGEVSELAVKAQIAIGEYWADQFRKLQLVPPMEKNLALKDRLFRKSLAAFEKAEREAPLESSVHATRRSGDLMVEFGKAILGAQRPKGLKGEERAKYEEALAARARTFFERAADWYTGALDRIEDDEGSPDLALPILLKLEETQELLAETPGGPESQ
jgi:TolA-binding protein